VSEVFAQVCQHIDLRETDYFGLAIFQGIVKATAKKCPRLLLFQTYNSSWFKKYSVDLKRLAKMLVFLNVYLSLSHFCALSF